MKAQLTLQYRSPQEVMAEPMHGGGHPRDSHHSPSEVQAYGEVLSRVSSPASLSRLAAKGTKEVAWSPEAPRAQPESWSVLFSKSFMHDFYDNHNMWVLADHQSADPFLAFKSSSRLMYFKGGWGWHNFIDWLIICRI